MALNDEGSLWVLGDGIEGIMESSTTPRLFSVGPWRNMSFGAGFALFVARDGSLWCIGDNEEGQLGEGTAWTEGPGRVRFTELKDLQGIRPVPEK
jgi:hypothetical protein